MTPARPSSRANPLYRPCQCIDTRCRELDHNVPGWTAATREHANAASRMPSGLHLTASRSGPSARRRRQDRRVTDEMTALHGGEPDAGVLLSCSTAPVAWLVQQKADRPVGTQLWSTPPGLSRWRSIRPGTLAADYVATQVLPDRRLLRSRCAFSETPAKTRSFWEQMLAELTKVLTERPAMGARLTGVEDVDD